MLNKKKFQIRNATLDDLESLVELEKAWPAHARANRETLKLRLVKFSPGYFVAEDRRGMIASIIAHPYQYQTGNLANFKSWATVVHECYHENIPFEQTNALYIVSGTTKKTPYVTELFDAGINLIVDLARAMGKQYVVGGSLLPGFAKYREKEQAISAVDYVFKTTNGRYIDPLIEKYRRVGFSVPDENHVIEKYFPDDDSIGYSALVVKDLSQRY